MSNQEQSPLQICYEKLYLPFFKNFNYKEICDFRDRLNLPTSSTNISIIVDLIIKGGHVTVLDNPREEIIEKMEKTLKQSIDYKHVAHYMGLFITMLDKVKPNRNSVPQVIQPQPVNDEPVPVRGPEAVLLELQTRLNNAAIEIALLNQTHNDDDNEIIRLQRENNSYSLEITNLKRELEIARSQINVNANNEISRLKQELENVYYQIASLKRELEPPNRGRREIQNEIDIIKSCGYCVIENDPDFRNKWAKYANFFKNFSHQQLYDIVQKLKLDTFSRDPEVIMKEMYKKNPNSLTYDSLSTLVKDMGLSGLIYNLI